MNPPQRCGRLDTVPSYATLPETLPAIEASRQYFESYPRDFVRFEDVGMTPLLRARVDKCLREKHVEA